MDALCVIPLADAKSWLVIEDTDSDAAITRLIKTAVAWVENYTSYRLFEREVTIVSTSCKTTIPIYPVTVTGIVKQDEAVFEIVVGTVTYGTLKMFVNCPEQSTITLTVGYSEEDIASIPQPLIDACYKLITYLFENRDAYGTTLPIDIQVLINQYRRDATI